MQIVGDKYTRMKAKESVHLQNWKHKMLNQGEYFHAASVDLKHTTGLALDHTNVQSAGQC